MTVTLTIPIKINSEKKHSVRYDAIESNTAISSVYVMKNSIPSKISQNIIVKIEMESE